MEKNRNLQPIAINKKKISALIYEEDLTLELYRDFIVKTKKFSIT